MNLKVVIPPAVEPVTVDEVKTHSHISHSDAGETALIARLIKSAREFAEAYQRRAYITQTLELSMDRFPPTPLCIPRSPLQTVVSLKYFDYANSETTYPSSKYYIDTTSEPGRLDLVYAEIWPTTILRSINAVVLRFTAGYGAAASAVPDHVKDAIILHASYRLENRAAEADDIPPAFFHLLSHDRIW